MAIMPQPSRWVLAERFPEVESVLVDALGISPVVAALLSQRGISEPANADKFLHPKLSDLHDPTLLPDYEQAKNEILGARERGELIYIHGDYDVDGVTSTATLHRFLATVGANVQSHVPHRMREGYGINLSAVEAAKQQGAKVFLTCDCGISAHEQVEAAKEAGMRVVVTDHHAVGSELPQAHAVVNPHRTDSKYPFSALSGAGVVFKLCAGLTRELGHNVDNFYRAYLDLAALGTVADVMPLHDENRIIAKFGLERLEDTKKAGLRALKEVADVKPPLRTYHIGFQLGPRINAVGRMDDSDLALRLLLENDYGEAMKLALEIDTYNVERKDAQQRMIDEAVEMVESQGLASNYVITLGHEEWHSGIVGLVAGRLVERYNRPAFCFVIDRARGIYKGSARSIPAFSLIDAIRQFPDLIEGGGHTMAAGCAFKISDFDAVSKLLDGFARSILKPEDLAPAYAADLEVDPGSLSLEVMEQVAMLEPFGNSNPEPIFVSRNLDLTSIKPTRNPAHVQLQFRGQDGKMVPASGFNMGARFAESRPGQKIDVLFRSEIDTYSGRRVKWTLKDFAEV
jgi:single-stranded-DNA-specific exonuclease